MRPSNTIATLSDSPKTKKAGEYRYFIGGSRDIRPEVRREGLPLGVVTKDPNRRWYEQITGRIPVGWYVVAVCYATAAILLGWWPWNFLLLLLLPPISNKCGRFYAFWATRSNRIMQPRVSSTRGNSL
jgi:hypothetical protein